MIHPNHHRSLSNQTKSVAKEVKTMSPKSPRIKSPVSSMKLNSREVHSLSKVIKKQNTGGWPREKVYYNQQ